MSLSLRHILVDVQGVSLRVKTIVALLFMWRIAKGYDPAKLYFLYTLVILLLSSILRLWFSENWCWTDWTSWRWNWNATPLEISYARVMSRANPFRISCPQSSRLPLDPIKIPGRPDAAVLISRAEYSAKGTNTLRFKRELPRFRGRNESAALSAALSRFLDHRRRRDLKLITKEITTSIWARLSLNIVVKSRSFPFTFLDTHLLKCYGVKTRVDRMMHAVARIARER